MCFRSGKATSPRAGKGPSGLFGENAGEPLRIALLSRSPLGFLRQRARRCPSVGTRASAVWGPAVRCPQRWPPISRCGPIEPYPRRERDQDDVASWCPMTSPRRVSSTARDSPLSRFGRHEERSCVGVALRRASRSSRAERVRRGAARYHLGRRPAGRGGRTGAATDATPRYRNAAPTRNGAPNVPIARHVRRSRVASYALDRRKNPNGRSRNPRKNQKRAPTAGSGLGAIGGVTLRCWAASSPHEARGVTLLHVEEATGHLLGSAHHPVVVHAGRQPGGHGPGDLVPRRR